MQSFQPDAVPMPTLNQVVALSFVYRLLLKVLQIAPICMITLPFLLRASYFVFDRLTNNHTILSLLLTCALTLFMRRLIRRAAPSDEKGQAALSQTEFGLPCAMFIVSSLLMIYVITPLESRLGIRSYLTAAPVITFEAAFRLAAFALLLGFSVVLRYVGPPSVMRCSSAPLLAHPLQITMQDFLSNLSVDSMLDFIAGPNSAMPGELFKTPLDHRGNSRRLQQPLFTAVVAQFLVSTSLAWILAYISVLPFFPAATHGETPMKRALILTCIIATLSHLYRKALNGETHELNPTRHHEKISWTRAVRKWIQAGNLVVPSLLILGTAIFVQTYSTVPKNEQDNDQIMFTISISVITGSSVYLFLDLFDHALRQLLCSYSTNMIGVVAEIAGDDRRETYLDVAITSILHSDANLIKMITDQCNLNYNDLERDELRRHANSIKFMATTLLSKPAADMGAYLEDDILRLSILGSLGGGATLNGGQHETVEIRQWVETDTSSKMKTLQSESLVVPLVRALCTYIGGLGEALFICFPQGRSQVINPWKIPVGATVCATYAVRGAARCILLNLITSTKTLSDWRSTHLSMLIPVFLTGLFRLESGMVKYASSEVWEDGPYHATHSQKIDLFRAEKPELLLLYEAIVESAQAILDRLKSLEGIRRLNLTVEEDCSRWIESILGRNGVKPTTTGNLKAYPNMLFPAKKATIAD